MNSNTGGLCSYHERTLHVVQTFSLLKVPFSFNAIFHLSSLSFRKKYVHCKQVKYFYIIEMYTLGMVNFFSIIWLFFPSLILLLC